MAFNLFDFSSVKTGNTSDKSMNPLAAALSSKMGGVFAPTPFAPLAEPTLAPGYGKERKNPFEEIPVSTVSEKTPATTPKPSIIEKYLSDPSISEQGKKNMVSEIEAGNIDLSKAESIVNDIYAKKESEKGFFERVGEAGMERFGKALDVAQSGQSKASQVLQTGGQAAGFVGDVFGEALVSAYRLAGEPGKETAKELLKTEAGQSALSAIAQGAEAYGEWKAKNPETAGNLEAVVNIGSLVPIGKGAQVGGKFVAEGAVEGAKVVGKGAMKAVPATGKAAGAATEFVANQITGLSAETRALIKESPDLFKKAQTGEISGLKVAEDFKYALEKRRNDLSVLGKEYDKLRTGKTVADGGEVTGAFDKALKDVDFKNLTKEDESAIMEAKSYLDRYAEGNVTDTDLLSLRHQLDSTVSWDKNVSKYGEGLVKSIRKEIDSMIEKKIPGSKELDAKYAKEKSEIDSVLKSVLGPDGNLKDNAITTITNLTGKNKEVKLEKFLKIVPGMDDKIRALKAFEDVSTTAGQKVGQYVKGGLLGGALATTNLPLAVAGFIATNPYVAAYVLQQYGFAKQAIKKVLENAKIGKKIQLQEAKNVLEAFSKADKTSVEKAIIESPTFVPRSRKLISIAEEVKKSAPVPLRTRKTQVSK